MHFSIFSGCKVDLLGALGRSKFKIFSSFQKHREKSKNKEIGNLYAKSVFYKIDFSFWCNCKKNYLRYLKFSLNDYISIINTKCLR